MMRQPKDPKTIIYFCTACFLCTSAFWLVWLLSGRGSHLGWLHWSGLVLFIVWPVIYFGMSVLVLGRPTTMRPTVVITDPELLEKLKGCELTPSLQQTVVELQQLQVQRKQLDRLRQQRDSGQLHQPAGQAPVAPATRGTKKRNKKKV